MSTRARLQWIAFAALVFFSPQLAHAVANFLAALKFNGTAATWTAATGGATGKGLYWNSTDDKPHIFSSASSFDFAPAAFSANFTGLGANPTLTPSVGLGGTQSQSVDAHATNSAGTITLGSTSTGTASATVVTINFAAPLFATAPHCSLDPANAAAQALAAGSQLFIDAASTTASVANLKTGASALPAGTYLYSYLCVQ